MDAAEVVSLVNERHGADWRVAEWLAGGYQEGSFLLLDQVTASKAVLKWQDRPMSRARLDELAATLDCGRAAGWPTPGWLAWGLLGRSSPYVVAEFVEGRRLEVPGAHELQRLLATIELQASLDPPTAYDWSAYAVSVAFDGAGGFAERVAAFSGAGQRLVKAIAEGASVPRRTLRTDDLVHGNLDPENVLCRDGQVVGIVDILSCGRGTRVYDLATLAVVGALWDWERPLLDRIVERCLSIDGADTLFTCVAANLLLILEFGVAHWPHGVDDCARGGLDLLRELSRSA